MELIFWKLTIASTTLKSELKEKRLELRNLEKKYSDFTSDSVHVLAKPVYNSFLAKENKVLKQNYDKLRPDFEAKKSVNNQILQHTCDSIEEIN